MPHQNFIAGEWVDAQDGATDSVLNPATGEAIADVPASSAADVDAAVAAAKDAYAGWRTATPRARSEALLAIAKLQYQYIIKRLTTCTTIHVVNILTKCS